LYNKLNERNLHTGKVSLIQYQIIQSISHMEVVKNTSQIMQDFCGACFDIFLEYLLASSTYLMS
jgi:hypothetical protein